MKLADHVDNLRELIEASFDKQFSVLGFGKTKATEADKLPATVKDKRERFEAMMQSHSDETGGYEQAREKLLDELTFTLFNRLAAIKIMEAANLFPPILTKQAEHGDRSFGHKIWLEINPHMRDEELEGVRDYLKIAFDELGQTLPLYSKTYPYALLPDTISLNDIIDAFNEVEKDVQVGEDIWLSDDVLGWMYESYNNKKKQAHKDSKAKTEYDKVSLQSQVYTPRWVVQFLVENSLGKMYLEMYPNSEIKQRFKIANPPTTKVREIKPLHEVRTIDPACGSGNFLLYAFDFYYELYLDQIENYGADYEERDIPKLIIEHNLHGIDLDDRAVQLAQLGLFIKAKKKRRNIGELKFKVVSSDFYLPEYDEVRHIFEQSTGVERNQQQLIEKVWSDLRYAYKFGSLVRIDEQLQEQLHAIETRATDDLFAAADIAEHQSFSETFFKNLAEAVEQYARTDSNTFLTSQTRDAITFLELLTTKYDVATANPPYTDSADFGPELKDFIDINYKKPYGFHTNLYASFIKRCFELTKKDGQIALIHPQTFMSIKTFQGVREFIINNSHIEIMIDFGLDRVNLFGPGILLDAVFYVINKKLSNEDGLFFDLASNIQEKYKKSRFFDALESCLLKQENERVYKLNQSKLKIIKSWPFIYWISDDFREKFNLPPLEEFADIKSGLATANNMRFLRYWWEIDREKISEKYDKDKAKWVRYAKGGTFSKWYGNLWLVVNWGNSGQEMRETGRAVFRNQHYYFKKGITYSATSTKGTSFRQLPENCIYDVKGASAFIEEGVNYNYILALFNSKLNSYIVRCLNNTVETQVGDIKRVPFANPTVQQVKTIDDIVKVNVETKKHILSFKLREMEFASHPYSAFRVGSFKDRTKEFLNYENYANCQILINEAIINNYIYEVYNLTKNDRKMVVDSEGVNIAELPITSSARDAYISFGQSMSLFSLETTNDFINCLTIKEFSIEDVCYIEKELPSLYLSNYDLEEFCIQHKINPINVWYWFKSSNTIPKQRINILAMEFLADMIREILLEDEDGIVPMVPNAGEKILLDRIEDKFFEKKFNTSQIVEFESILEKTLRDYICNSFMNELSDYLNLFPNICKTPFIWHLTSGPERGFECYIIIYKWNRDKLMSLRSVYIENRERALINRQSDLAGNDSAEAQNEKERIFKQLREIDSFKNKIDELLAEGYNPILDDGVGKNIAPLQQKKMLSYDVLNAGQLKKYLNADW